MIISMDGVSLELNDDQEEFYEDQVWKEQGSMERLVRDLGLIENDKGAKHCAERIATLRTLRLAGVL